jgi:hypothetical protein
MTQDAARHGNGTTGHQLGLFLLGLLGGVLISLLAMGLFRALGGVVALFAAAALYRSRPLRAAAVGMVVGGAMAVAVVVYLLFDAYEGLMAM